MVAGVLLMEAVVRDGLLTMNNKKCCESTMDPIEKGQGQPTDR